MLLAPHRFKVQGSLKGLNLEKENGLAGVKYLKIYLDGGAAGETETGAAVPAVDVVVRRCLVVDLRTTRAALDWIRGQELQGEMPN